MCRSIFFRAARVAALLFLFFTCLQADSFYTPQGRMKVDAQAGTYEVQTGGKKFSQNLGVPLTSFGKLTATDPLGTYSQVAFDFIGADSIGRHVSIKSYWQSPQLIFTEQLLADAPNDPATSFPRLTTDWSGEGKHHINYYGAFASSVYDAGLQDGPAMFFDTKSAFVISAASHFPQAILSFGPAGELVTGIDPAIGTLPKGFSHQTLVVVANAPNAAFDLWGKTLTTLIQAPQIDPEDLVASKLGYWTSQGSPYWWYGLPAANLEPTLLSMVAQARQLNAPFGYVELDSYFYPKGSLGLWDFFAGGIFTYTAHPDLFPHGLAAFGRQLGVPFVGHMRWIDPASDYHNRYAMSADVSIDPGYWRDEIDKFSDDSNFAGNIQDWLSQKARPAMNLTDADGFFSAMANAVKRSILYCMALPSQMMEGMRYKNVVYYRGSQDRLDPSKWDAFLQSARLILSLGKLPFTDAFASGETGNFLFSVLSAGPVGVNDALGQLNANNLHHAVRADGFIVKPDRPLLRLDRKYAEDIQDIYATGGQTVQPMIASTLSDFGSYGARYVFAYTRNPKVAAYGFALREIGTVGQPALVYDYFTGNGRVVDADGSYSGTIDPGLGFSYQIVVPLNYSGIAFLGDLGHWVTLGRKRVSDVTDFGDSLRATVQFAQGETYRSLAFYSEAPITFSATSGSITNVVHSGAWYSVTVAPSAAGAATLTATKL